MKIAVVGSGVAGLAAAWLLSKSHDVTIYEAGDRLGGHANTVDVTHNGQTIPVDTGFIVFNDKNYPNLTALFEHLGVASHPTEMTFALSTNGGAYEYSGTGLNGVFGQRRNLWNGAHWTLLKDLTRFFRKAKAQIARHDHWISLENFLAEENYSDEFINDHIVPMGAAIWSTNANDMLQYPARSFIEFYENHGLLGLFDWPKWRSVLNGSRTYVSALNADSNFETLLNCGVTRVTRHENHVHVTDQRGVSRAFDQIVFASHADQSLAMIQDPSAEETRILSPFQYQKNVAVLHRDLRLMPKRRRLWSSWNYLKNTSDTGEELCVTYWMNRLQNLQTSQDYFVTLNPSVEIHPKLVDHVVEYHHPVFNEAAKRMQHELVSLQGQNRTWFCGSYFGHGFHEDGLASGLNVAEQLGGIARPWSDQIVTPLERTQTDQDFAA